MNYSSAAGASAASSLGCLGFAGFFRRGLRLRRKEHGHVLALKLGRLVKIRYLRALFRKVLEQRFANLGVRHLSASETHRDLEAVALVEELLAVFQLGVEVVRVDAGGHAYLLDLDNALILLGFLLLLGLLEAELAVVHNLADRGLEPGAILTRSRSCSAATFRASSADMIPSCSP